MPTSAAVSSSSASPGRDRAGPAGSARSWCFAGGGRAFFVHGFAKSDRENLRRNELGALRALANEMLGLDAMLSNGTIGEVNCDG